MRKALALVGGLALLWSMTGCKPQPKAPEAKPPEVKVTMVETGAINQYLTTIGSVIAYDEVQLVARVEGFLLKRNFTEGQMVKKGDLLYEIEPDQYISNGKAAEAQLEHAKAGQKNAEIEYARQKSLLDQKATSQREYDNAQAGRMKADADVANAEAQLAIARLQLSYTKIYAPFDGWVGLTRYGEGNLVGQNNEILATVQRVDPMRVEFVLTELDVIKLMKYYYRGPETDHDGLRVRLFLQNGDEYGGKGQIKFWDNRINTNTGTLKLQALFENPENILVPGMFVRVRIESARPTEAPVIPLIAVIKDQSGEYVYIVDRDDTVRRRTIQTGFKTERFAIVTAGLAVGERVITDGLQKVRPGVKVVATPDDDPRNAIPKPAAAPDAKNAAKPDGTTS
jgi:membrane fusion protein (multidrug efflux system)